MIAKGRLKAALVMSRASKKSAEQKQRDHASQVSKAYRDGERAEERKWVHYWNGLDSKARAEIDPYYRVRDVRPFEFPKQRTWVIPLMGQALREMPLRPSSLTVHNVEFEARLVAFDMAVGDTVNRIEWSVWWPKGEPFDLGGDRG